MVYKDVAPLLASKGYRVLLYDLYGRGYSDAPQQTVYDTSLYTTQLALLMQHVRWEEAAVVGISMVSFPPAESVIFAPPHLYCHAALRFRFFFPFCVSFIPFLAPARQDI